MPIPEAKLALKAAVHTYGLMFKGTWLKVAFSLDCRRGMGICNDYMKIKNCEINAGEVNEFSTDLQLDNSNRKNAY